MALPQHLSPEVVYFFSDAPWAVRMRPQEGDERYDFLRSHGIVLVTDNPSTPLSEREELKPKDVPAVVQKIFEAGSRTEIEQAISKRRLYRVELSDFYDLPASEH